MNLIRHTKHLTLPSNGEGIREHLQQMHERLVSWTSHGTHDNRVLWVIEDSMCRKASEDDDTRTVRARLLRTNKIQNKATLDEQRLNIQIMHRWLFESKQQRSNTQTVVRVPIVAKKSGNADGAKWCRKMDDR